MGRLTGQVAIVTGAAQGIGAVYAKALAAEGAKLALCDLSVPTATISAIRDAGGEAIGQVCDVSDPKAVAALVARTDEAFGGVHVLVNNAAVFGSLSLKPFQDIDSAEWDLVMKVNVRGSFECAKAVLPVMRRQHYGKIINVASATVFKGMPMLVHYVASKGAIVALTRSIAREVGDLGICVNCLAPGLTMSEAVKSKDNWDAFITSNIASRCIKREETADDLIGALLFLASSDSNFTTGQTIVVDGGSVTH